MEKVKFNDVFEDDSKNISKLNNNEFEILGKIAIIDQGKNKIAGYTSKSDLKICNEERIIFGDHTRIIKYINVPFVTGADGTKVLKIKDKNKFNYKYYYYYLLASYIPNTGYNRHFKWIKELEFCSPDYNIQVDIANKLDKVQEIIDLRKKQIEELDELIKSQFVEMFGNIEKKIQIKNCCSKITDYVASGSFASIRENVKTYDIPEYAIMVRTADFANKFKKNLTYTDKHGYEFLHNSNLFGGEVLLSNIGASIGKVHRVPFLNRPMTLAPNAIMLKSNDSYLDDYIQYYFLSDEGQMQLKSMTTATAMPKFNKTQFKEIYITDPPLELQKNFTEIVKQIDKQKLEIQKSLEETEEIMESLMNKYFGE